MTILIGESTSLFIRVLSLHFFRVGLRSHTIIYVAGDVATRRASDRGGNHRSRGPKSTRSSIKARAEKNRVSGLDGRLTWCHVEDAEAMDPHRTDRSWPDRGSF